MRGGRHRDGEIRSNVISSQGVHDRYGGVVPEIASRHHLELVNAVVDDALGAGRRRRSTTSNSVAVTQGPGLVGALLVGVATAKALAAARRRSAGRRSTTSRATSRRTSSRPDAVRPAVPVPRRQRRPHVPRARRRPRRLRGPRRDARRRRRRGVRQGRAPARPAATRAARARARWRRRATRAAFAFPTAQRVAGPRLLLRRPQDRAALHGPRPRRGRGAARRADLAASYQHAIVEALALRVERALERDRPRRLAIGGGVAANRPLRERAARARRRRGARPAARAVHRQRGDDRLRGALPRAGSPSPDYLGLDAYATGERAL